MKIYNNMNITYSAIEQNSRKNTKQNIPADLEKKNDTVHRYTFYFKDRAGNLLSIYHQLVLWIMSIGLKMK